jgi:hypothetical protein
MVPISGHLIWLDSHWSIHSCKIPPDFLSEFILKKKTKCASLSLDRTIFLWYGGHSIHPPVVPLAPVAQHCQLQTALAIQGRLPLSQALLLSAIIFLVMQMAVVTLPAIVITAPSILFKDHTEGQTLKVTTMIEMFITRFPYKIKLSLEPASSILATSRVMVMSAAILQQVAILSSLSLTL